MEAWIELVAATIRIATPLLVGAMGAILSERGGTFAVSLEGQMLAGALAAVLVATVAGPAAGAVAAMGAGVAVAGLAALATGRFRADHMVTGIALNLLVLGLTSFAARLAGVGRVALLPALPLGGAAQWPVIGPALLAHPPITWLGLLMVPLLGWVLARSVPGLALRAAGENPEAAITAGLSPARARAAGVLAGGALGGLAGAALALQQVGTFTDGMTSGRGFLALAAVIVGRWRPGATLLACLGFGLAEALQFRMQAFALPVSSYVVQMAPYLLALFVLAALGRGARMPAAIGRPIGS